ncbi:MAG: hypothetical protein ACRDWG_21130, partial [Actinomycetes bacterium]
MSGRGDRARLRVVRDFPTLSSIPDNVGVPRRLRPDRRSPRREPPATCREQPAAWGRAAVPLGCALALAVGGVLLLAASADAGDPAAHAEHGASATAAQLPGMAPRLRSTAPQPAPS